MTTVQLLAVRDGQAVVQKDDEPSVEISWGLLHAAQQQNGVAGYVYRWLMHEFCRCEYEQRQGRTWHSPRREVGEIVADLRARDAAEAAEAEAARQEERRRRDAAERRRQRDDEMRRVEAERRATAAHDPWWPIPPWEVPTGVRFDTLPRDQGQIVEVSYGTFGRAEAGRSGPYMCISDLADDKPAHFYRRREMLAEMGE